MDILSSLLYCITHPSPALVEKLKDPYSQETKKRLVDLAHQRRVSFEETATFFAHISDWSWVAAISELPHEYQSEALKGLLKHPDLLQNIDLLAQHQLLPRLIEIGVSDQFKTCPALFEWVTEQLATSGSHLKAIDSSRWSILFLLDYRDLKKQSRTDLISALLNRISVTEVATAYVEIGTKEEDDLGFGLFDDDKIPLLQLVGQHLEDRMLFSQTALYELPRFYRLLELFIKDRGAEAFQKRFFIWPTEFEIVLNDFSEENYKRIFRDTMPREKEDTCYCNLLYQIRSGGEFDKDSLSAISPLPPPNHKKAPLYAEEVAKLCIRILAGRLKRGQLTLVDPSANTAAKTLWMELLPKIQPPVELASRCSKITEIEKLKRQIEELKAELTTLKKEVEEEKRKRTELEDRLKGLQARLDALSAEAE